MPFLNEADIYQAWHHRPDLGRRDGLPFVSLCSRRSGWTLVLVSGRYPDGTAGGTVIRLSAERDALDR